MKSVVFTVFCFLLLSLKTVYAGYWGKHLDFGQVGSGHLIEEPFSTGLDAVRKHKLFTSSSSVIKRQKERELLDQKFTDRESYADTDARVNNKVLSSYVRIELKDGNEGSSHSRAYWENALDAARTREALESTISRVRQTQAFKLASMAIRASPFGNIYLGLLALALIVAAFFFTFIKLVRERKMPKEVRTHDIKRAQYTNNEEVQMSQNEMEKIKKDIAKIRDNKTTSKKTGFFQSLNKNQKTSYVGTVLAALFLSVSYLASGYRGWISEESDYIMYLSMTTCIGVFLIYLFREEG